MTSRPIVAVCLLNRQELELLGPAFDRAFPVQDAPCFRELLSAIDDADREWWREQDRKRGVPPTPATAQDDRGTVSVDR